jgi:hypothetical protein
VIVEKDSREEIVPEPVSILVDLLDFGGSSADMDVLWSVSV